MSAPNVIMILKSQFQALEETVGDEAIIIATDTDQQTIVNNILNHFI